MRTLRLPWEPVVPDDNMVPYPEHPPIMLSGQRTGLDLSEVEELVLTISEEEESELLDSVTEESSTEDSAAKSNSIYDER